MRKGLGIGFGKGYKNIISIDRYIHSLSARGVKTKLYWVTVGVYAKNKDDAVTKAIHPNKNISWFAGCDEKVEDKKLDAKGKGFFEPDRIKFNEKENKEIDDWVKRVHYKIFSKKKHKNKLSAKGKKILNLKLPTVEILSSKQFDTKFKDDYEDYEQGYATTKIMPDGTTKVYVRDDGNNDYSREGKLLMHELKEIEIFKDLVNNKGVSPSIADEMAHNMNPVKVEGVSDTYDLNAYN